MKTNQEAIELQGLLGSIPAAKNTHREYAASLTLRNMNKWAEDYNSRLAQIDKNNSLTKKDEDGNMVFVTKSLSLTKTTEKGTITEEVSVPIFSETGEKKRAKEKNDLKKEKIKVPFEIIQTGDDAGLTLYQKISLHELGFFKNAPSIPTEVNK